MSKTQDVHTKARLIGEEVIDAWKEQHEIPHHPLILNVLVRL